MKIVRDISMPIRPEGDPMGQNIGPGAWAERSNTPDLTIHGTPKIVPIAPPWPPLRRVPPSTTATIDGSVRASPLRGLPLPVKTV